MTKLSMKFWQDFFCFSAMLIFSEIVSTSSLSDFLYPDSFVPLE